MGRPEKQAKPIDLYEVLGRLEEIKKEINRVSTLVSRYARQTKLDK